MDLVSNVLMGFGTALEPTNLLFCFIGVLLGTLVGILPGLGPSAVIALLLPMTFHLSPTSSIIMLAGIYYGAMYGGSTTSILVNIPGEAASTVTCLDGYQMARKGRAGPALGISAFASFVAGTASVFFLMVMAPLLAEGALKFGPPEYFSLMLLAVILLVFLSSGALAKGLLMASFGFFLGTIGADTFVGTTRFTLGTLTLMDGVGLVPLLMGIFGIGEVLSNLEQPITREIFETKINNIYPTSQDWIDSKWAIVRGTIIGFFLGILPGGGATIASFAGYSIEKRLSKTPEKFGTGMIAGVANPEAANNAAAGGAFIPLLALGIPGTAVMAIMLGALMIQGVQPGPLFISDHPQLFWGVVTSMYIGNIMLLVLNLPLIGLWVHILRIPYVALFPLILMLCLIGAYSLKNDIGDVLLVIIFGMVGYLLRKYKFEISPLILAFILGPKIEVSLRRSLLLSDGNPFIFFQRPISAVLMLLVISLLVSNIFTLVKSKRKGIQ